MDKFYLLFYSILAVLSMLVAQALYFFTDNIAEFSNAWNDAADYYHKKIESV